MSKTDRYIIIHHYSFRYICSEINQLNVLKRRSYIKPGRPIQTKIARANAFCLSKKKAEILYLVKKLVEKQKLKEKTYSVAKKLYLLQYTMNLRCVMLLI